MGLFLYYLDECFYGFFRFCVGWCVEECGVVVCVSPASSETHTPNTHTSTTTLITHNNNNNNNITLKKHQKHQHLTHTQKTPSPHHHRGALRLFGGGAGPPHRRHLLCRGHLAPGNNTHTLSIFLSLSIYFFKCSLSVCILYKLCMYIVYIEAGFLYPFFAGRHLCFSPRASRPR